ncbi:integrase core domain-containing protein [bacterium]|nr:integrase core domain-containing protein [bacterium]
MKPKNHRKVYDGVFKSRVVLEVLRGEKTLSEIASEYSIHPNQITQWKKQDLRAYENVWEAERSIGAYIQFYNQERLHSSLGDQTPLSLYKSKSGLLSISEKGENKSL